MASSVIDDAIAREFVVRDAVGPAAVVDPVPVKGWKYCTCDMGLLDGATHIYPPGRRFHNPDISSEATGPVFRLEDANQVHGLGVHGLGVHGGGTVRYRLSDQPSDREVDFDESPFSTARMCALAHEHLDNGHADVSRYLARNIAGP